MIFQPCSCSVVQWYGKGVLQLSASADEDQPRPAQLQSMAADHQTVCQEEAAEKKKKRVNKEIVAIYCTLTNITNIILIILFELEKKKYLYSASFGCYCLVLNKVQPYTSSL